MRARDRNDCERLRVLDRNQRRCECSVKSGLRMPVAVFVVIGRFEFRPVFGGGCNVVVMMRRLDEIVNVILVAMNVIIVVVNVRAVAVGVVVEIEARARRGDRR
ncbi:MAG TPA: hypothetical protein VMJ74_10110, partial [Pseudomonadales bacterium]|nr:hypothetical protein [Pseudomonadales bacterium]